MRIIIKCLLANILYDFFFIFFFMKIEIIISRSDTSEKLTKLQPSLKRFKSCPLKLQCQTLSNELTFPKRTYHLIT